MIDILLSYTYKPLGGLYKLTATKLGELDPRVLPKGGDQLKEEDFLFLVEKVRRPERWSGKVTTIHLIPFNEETAPEREALQAAGWTITEKVETKKGIL